jgi:hypothetical protein
MRKYEEMRKYLTIYEEAVSHICFLFISACAVHVKGNNDFGMEARGDTITKP